jgi:hypothetical protein
LQSCFSKPVIFFELNTKDHPASEASKVEKSDKFEGRAEITELSPSKNDKSTPYYFFIFLVLGLSKRK